MEKELKILLEAYEDIGWITTIWENGDVPYSEVVKTELRFEGLKNQFLEKWEPNQIKFNFLS
jgi:hypothetical protein